MKIKMTRQFFVTFSTTTFYPKGSAVLELFHAYGEMEAAGLAIPPKNEIYNTPIIDEEAIDKCLEELITAIQLATAASAPKGRPRADPQPPLPASIQAEEPVEEAVANRDGRRSEKQVNRFQTSVTYRLNEWKAEQWSDTPESLDSEDQSPWKMTEGDARSQFFAPLQVPRGLFLSDSQKAEVLAGSLEAQLRTWHLLRWLVKRWAHKSMPPQLN
jgi:hypothetical protein